MVFQRLRQLFGIDNMDYLLSLTGDRCALSFHTLQTLSGGNGLAPHACEVTPRFVVVLSLLCHHRMGLQGSAAVGITRQVRQRLLPVRR